MKRELRPMRVLLSLVSVLILGSLLGCALEYAPKGRWLYYPNELPAADRAVEAARQAGKDKECPDEFKAAEKMRDDAYEAYWACRTAEGIAMAKEATAKVSALCPVKAAAPPPPPPPAPPTVSLTANPATIQQGKCSTLSWSSMNAAQAAIDQGLGGVALSGSREVCPSSDTNYTITATGPGGTRTASTAIAVTPLPPPPTVSLSANPATIEQGKCSTLSWTSTNAAQAAIDQGLGGVALSGSREVCPSSNTNYTITATGPGGTQTSATTVSVTPPPPAPKVIDRLTLHINFDFDKAVIRKADIPELEKAVAFVKKYPGARVSVEGHTDSIGSEQYNQGLSERRATAVKDYLVKAGAADPSRIQTVGYGKTRPIADNKTKQGRFENRRVEVLILSE